MKKITTLFLLLCFGKLFSQNNTVYIPVVFHVVYNGAAENVPDTQIFQHLQALNIDFSDTTCPNTYTNDADTHIQFCLASVDPNGSPTNGITRTSTTVSTFMTDNKVKFGTQGGHDAWDRDRYLNIWICDLGIVSQYAQFPGGNAATDGIVLNYKHIYGGSVPYNLGRQGVFAVGNWFGVRQILGGCSIDSDTIADTPSQALVIICTSQIDVCSGIPFAVLGKNFMQSSPENCMCFFTPGQVAKMWSTLNGVRASLLTSNACTAATGVSSVADTQQFSVFPNPSSGVFEVRSDASFGGWRVLILNSLGQKLELTPSQDKTLRIDLSDKPEGIYHLNMVSDKFSVTRQLVLIK